MATFPSIEASYGLRKNSAPKIRVVKFADGYEHRINLGLSEHQNPKEYNLAWNNITETDSDTIEYFLNERALDQASFTYTPPNEPLSKTGTYAQSGSTTITITITDHQLFACLLYPSPSPRDRQKSRMLLIGKKRSSGHFI